MRRPVHRNTLYLLLTLALSAKAEPPRVYAPGKVHTSPHQPLRQQSTAELAARAKQTADYVKANRNAAAYLATALARESVKNLQKRFPPDAVTYITSQSRKLYEDRKENEGFAFVPDGEIPASLKNLRAWELSAEIAKHTNELDADILAEKRIATSASGLNPAVLKEKLTKANIKIPGAAELDDWVDSDKFIPDGRKILKGAIYAVDKTAFNKANGVLEAYDSVVEHQRDYVALKRVERVLGLDQSLLTDQFSPLYTGMAGAMYEHLSFLQGQEDTWQTLASNFEILGRPVAVTSVPGQFTFDPIKAPKFGDHGAAAGKTSTRPYADAAPKKGEPPSAGADVQAALKAVEQTRTEPKGTLPQSPADAATDRYLTAIKQFEEALEKHRLDAPETKAAELEFKKSHANYQAEKTKEEIAAGKTEASQKHKGEMIQAGLMAVNALARLMAKSDPEAAHYFAASANLIGAVALASLNPATAPLVIAAAVFDFIASFFRGPDPSQLILEAIQKMHADLSAMREEMHQWFSFLSDDMRKNFEHQLIAMEKHFERQEELFRKGFRRLEILETQTQHAVGDVAAAQDGAEARRERQRIVGIHNELTGAFKPFARDGKNEKLLNAMMDKVHHCAITESVSWVPYNIDGKSMATAELPALYRFLSHGALDNYPNTQKTRDNLHVISQVFTGLGTPIAPLDESERPVELPHLGIWESCAEKYFGAFDSTDARVKANVAQWFRESRQGNPHSPTEEFLIPAKNAQRAVKTLIERPEVMEKAYDSLREQGGTLRGLVEKERADILHNELGAFYSKRTETPGHVDAGPFQSPWAIPEMRSKEDARRVITACPKDQARLAEKGFTQHSKHNITAAHPSLVRDMVATLPPEIQNAHALGLGNVTICLSDAEWVPADTAEYYPTFGSMYDWAQLQYAHQKLKFSIQYNGEKFGEFEW